MSSSSSSFRPRLVAFYTQYAPDKLDSVDDLLLKSQGKEEKLFEKLVAKYGPEPVLSSPSVPPPESNQQKASSSPSSAPPASSSHEKKPSKKEKSAKKEEDEERKRQAADEARALLEKLRKKDPNAVLPEPESSSDEEDDGYGTRDWWKARMVRFYKKYAPEKVEDVDKLLDKANDDPAQLDKLFRMLEKKYGPEPDPSSSSEEEEAGEEEQEEEGDEKSNEIPGLPVRIAYCPVDGVPAEYSEYLDTFPQALPWLAAHTPDLILQTKGNVTVAEYALAQGVAALALEDNVEIADKVGALFSSFIFVWCAEKLLG